ncbi:nuclear transport factor 2 family protein [Haladaptatus sp.]|uniref:nuclear transport factor 2 family protein n=1 Tax=Haladaptatus sp. TaxID=1973141 RepID=UPI003C3D2034
MNADDAETTVREYYEALREGEPLPPFFAAGESLVKFGISEQLVGYETVAEGLRKQTRESEDWTVTSSNLRVTERDRHAWFSDDVHMAWTDTDTETGTGTRHEFDTRWSGTLERRDSEEEGTEEWRFVGMHVSVARPF